MEKSKIFDVVKTTGYYVATDGKCYPQQSADTPLAYAQLIEVEAGDVITLLSNGKSVKMYLVIGYRGGATNDAVAVKETMSYTVTGDTDHVIVSFADNGGDYQLAVTNENARVKPELKHFVDKDTVTTLIKGESTFVPNLSKKVDALYNGYIQLQSNHIVNNKTLVFSFETDGLKDDAIIGLGHGETSYGGSGVEISADRIVTYNYAAGRRTNIVNEAHGIDISGKVKITIKTELRTARVIIDNGKDVYATTSFQWFGRNGEIFAKSVGVELKNAELAWRCDAYSYDVWYFGDSYFDVNTAARWPYYMVEDGITEFLLSGFPGRKTGEGLEDFKKALEFGTPKYAVWCLGMNNADSERGANASYKSATEEFLAICKEKGITPILATIPNTPTVINIYKNEWVKASGHRYVDFAAGVNAEEKGSPWGAGMLSGDNVHPAKAGAKALYEQLKKDLADIIVK